MIARHILLFPDKTSGTILSYKALDPNFYTGGKPIMNPALKESITPGYPMVENSSVIINSWKKSNSSG